MEYADGVGRSVWNMQTECMEYADGVGASLRVGDEELILLLYSTFIRYAGDRFSQRYDGLRFQYIYIIYIY